MTERAGESVLPAPARIALINRRSAVTVGENGRPPIPCLESAIRARTGFSPRAAAADVGGAGSHWKSACGRALCDLQIRRKTQRRDQQAEEDNVSREVSHGNSTHLRPCTQSIPGEHKTERGYSPRSLSKISRHSFSHAIPFFTLLKSAPSFLAISSNSLG
jgi:hypothetical protein